MISPTAMKPIVPSTAQLERLVMYPMSTKQNAAIETPAHSPSPV